MNTEKRDEFEIDIIDMLKFFISRWYIIIVLALVCALGVHFYMGRNSNNDYGAQATIFVGNIELENGFPLADDNILARYINDALYVGSSPKVIDKVIEDLDLEVTRESLTETVMIEKQGGTHFLFITVKNHEEEMAIKIADAIAEETCSCITDQHNMIEAKVFSKAMIVEEEEESFVEEIIRGGLLGVAASIVIIAGMYFTREIRNAGTKNKK